MPATDSIIEWIPVYVLDKMYNVNGLQISILFLFLCHYNVGNSYMVHVLNRFNCKNNLNSPPPSLKKNIYLIMIYD